MWSSAAGWRPPWRRARPRRPRGLRCHASVPLYAGDRPLGVMNLAMRGWRRLTRQELDLLTTIADQVSVAIERARLAGQSIEHARADERSRIARDVHDTLAQEFTAVGLHIEAGLSHLEPRNRARPALRLALDAARQGLDEARRSITSMRRSPLENRSLAEGLGALSRRFTAETGVRVRLDIADVGAVPADIESELFRIAGEALTNVRKHARASEVSLRLHAGAASAAPDGQRRRRRFHGARCARPRLRPVGHRGSRARRRRPRHDQERARTRHDGDRHRFPCAMIKVLIVEDHPIVREGVTAVLERERDIEVVGAAGTIGEGLRLAAKLAPDVVLLDLKLPDADAVDGVAELRPRRPQHRRLHGATTRTTMCSARFAAARAATC